MKKLILGLSVVLSLLLASPAEAAPRTMPNNVVALIGPSGVQASVLGSVVVPGYGPNQGMTDTTGHDTEVATLIYVNSYNSKIMPVVRDWCAGLNFAVVNGAKVVAIVQYSLYDIPCLRSAVANAIANDVVVLAGVPNDGAERYSVYPASYPGVIGIGSVDRNNYRSPWSMVGPPVDFVTLGENLPTYTKNGSLVYVSGNSYTTGRIAGLVSSIRINNPTWNRTQVCNYLKSIAQDIGAPGRDWWYGDGKLL